MTRARKQSAGDSDTAAYDAVVVGTGAGGGAAAYALAEAGATVLVLDAGPRFDPGRDYRVDQPDWEREGFPHKPNSRQAVTVAPLQPLEERWDDLRSHDAAMGRKTPGDRRRAHAYHHVQGLGGSTLAYTGEAHRLNPRAMHMRARFGVAADWPITYEELEPYYAEAERILGVAGPEAAPGARTVQNGRWRSTPFPLPPHRLSYASRVLGRGFAARGLSWEPNSIAALSRAYDGRPPCNYCCNCHRGCQVTDKGSVDVTFMRRAMQRRNCTVRLECRVLHLLTSTDDRVSGLVYRNREGRDVRVQAAVYLLACGAVETPRLLLLSASAHAPHGLANESGQVGRHFMETLSWASAGLHPEPLASYRGHPSDAVCWDFNDPDAIPAVIGGCRVSPYVGEGDLLGPIAYAQRIVPGWGSTHKQAIKRAFGRVLAVSAIGESLPNPGSFVDLDPDATDTLARPLARIHSLLPASELHRLSFMAQRCREVLQAAGVDRIVEESGTYDVFSATHVFGTCRMGDDPAESVVDRNGRCHRWRNLYIADASVFPSSGGGEGPALTVQALALRCARRILARGREAD